jgi:ATP-dependent RNA helicase RhlE
LTKFTDLGLSQPLLDALASKNYSDPTPIQAQAIPTVLTGRDLLGIAQTGTGKTAAFMLPSLDRLANPRVHPIAKRVRMLILAPTRELASQIAESARTYAKNINLTVGVIFGGTAPNKSVRDVARGLDVLVATPGRLLDLVDQRAIDSEPARNPRPRRGRPDARPRLHPCAQADRQSGAQDAPDPVLLGDHAQGDQAARRRLS